jgi:hypothetical protein
MLRHMDDDKWKASKEIVEVEKFTLIHFNILYVIELQI